MSIILIIHLFASFFLTGLIWTIQIVHYPGFKYIDKKNFSEFSQFHTSRITIVVLPLMLTELATAICLSYFDSLQNPSLNINLLAVLFIWLITILSSMKDHKKLAIDKSIKVIDHLIKINWLRTILWTTKSVLILFFTIKYHLR